VKKPFCWIESIFVQPLFSIQPGNAYKVTVSTRDVKHHSPMKFIGMIISAARAWQQASALATATKITFITPLKEFSDPRKNPAR
jgi:hypothetical protein